MVFPKMIPTLLNQGHDETISLMLSNPNDHIQNIQRLSTICKVRIKFKQPVTIYPNQCRAIKNVTEYVFSDFFLKGDSIYYRFKKGGCHGQFLPMQHIESYEPVCTSVDRFNKYEDFKKKFDTFFITEKVIKELWEGTSSQHGGTYKPSDFKQISKAGKEALRKFLTMFKGITNTDISTYTEQKYVNDKGIYHVCYGNYYGRGGNNSRDISISHVQGNNLVHYSSEYHGSGNGRYGLLANKSTYLWLEDD